MSPVARLAPFYNPTRSNGDTTPPPSYRASTQHKPSLDLSQRFERKLAEYNASQNIIKRWLFEIVSLAISAICMVCTTLDVQGMKHNQTSTDDGSILGLHNRHMYLHKGSASPRLATSLDHPKRTVQNCLGRPYTPNL